MVTVQEANRALNDAAQLLANAIYGGLQQRVEDEMMATGQDELIDDEAEGG